MPRTVSARMNRWLTRLVTKDEVKKVAFSINGNSAPGEDGFTGLTFLLNTEINQQRLHGVKMSRLEPPITYLFFVDDIILFDKPNKHSMVAIRNNVNSFEALSGLRVNLDKSAMFFSRNTSHRLQT
ncbi:hypothetical protein Cni_G28934 [Canna indica]|uniref:Reverse transcriptase domain-containing protein n=1 Tax=Canna indica TaxID=4628 RepID=A0AAQ3LAQ2_9LILI|nr:hypothetical protein Cni_G28934 [Canna indica]